MSLLTYMSCSAGSARVFMWFQNLATIASLFNWMSVSIAYIRFHSALRAQGISRSTLVFRSRWQPYAAWFSLIYFAIVTFFNGFYTFPSTHPSQSPKRFDVDNFITAYVGIPIYFGLYLFWKILKGTKVIDVRHADIQTGKAALDAADKCWPERKARNMWQKIWYFIA